MHIVYAGAGGDALVDELRSKGASVAAIEGVANRPALEDAGIHDADIFLLADAGQATSVVVAKDLNPAIRVVAYTNESLPEFTSAQEVLAIDPALLDPATLADELLGEPE